MGLQVPLLVQVQMPAQFFPNLPLGHTVKKRKSSQLQLEHTSQNPENGKPFQGHTQGPTAFT